ncbi:MAG: DNA topoisomerase IB [Pseudomonadota bacterium]
MEKSTNFPVTCGAIESSELVAKKNGLHYVTDEMPGIRRLRSGRGFRYVDESGKTIRDKETLQRIKSLVIPPGWNSVWICPLPHGHIQATARDSKARKQYRYHPRWRSVRDETKYERMMAFGKALPLIRKQVEADLSLPGMPREKVLAAVVRLLEKTSMRVGNEEYARNNHSFGLTTLRNQHVEIKTDKLRFHFRGKSGKYHDIELSDQRLARVVRRCRDLPGQDLFQYKDENGDIRGITSSDVNQYLRSITNEDYTAKDFRTWAGTILAAMALQELNKFDSETEAKKNIVQAIEHVAKRLGNTPAICRKCYVHPAVLDAYLDGSMLRTLKHRTKNTIRQEAHELSPEELSIIRLLQQRL